MVALAKVMAVAAITVGAVVLPSLAASAMPVDIGPKIVATQSGAENGIQEAYWRGGWHRHYGWHRHFGWRRPRWGWHRHWHHWR
jgi:hypothetical protein